VVQDRGGSERALERASRRAGFIGSVDSIAIAAGIDQTHSTIDPAPFK